MPLPYISMQVQGCIKANTAPSGARRLGQRRRTGGWGHARDMVMIVGDALMMMLLTHLTHCCDWTPTQRSGHHMDSQWPQDI